MMVGNFSSEPVFISESTKGCPTCGKQIEAVAETCPACGARFDVQTHAYCTHCHKLIITTADGQCPDCGGSDLLDPRLYSQLTTAGTAPVQPAAQSTPVAANAGTGPALAMQAGASDSVPAETKKCPCCAETIKAEARLCRFCGARFEVAIKGYCTNCHAEVPLDKNDQCSRCGSTVIDRHIASTLLSSQAPLPVSAPPSSASRSTVVSTPAVIPVIPVAAVSIPPGEKPRMPFWQLYLSPKGRIGRLTFFLKGMLPVWVLLGLCGVIFSSITPSMNTSRLSVTNGMFLSILLVAMLFILWIMLMLIIKRFHDLERSGWNILLWLIPLVGQIIYFVSWIQLYFKKGTGPNRFGDSAS